MELVLLQPQYQIGTYESSGSRPIVRDLGPPRGC